MPSSLARIALASAAVSAANAYSLAPVAPAARASSAASLRAAAPCMDETILEKTLAGELEEEGAENVFMTEVGWASYLDKAAKQSYNMNERVSQAQDGYFTADIFSNPADVIGDWLDSMKRVVGDPLSAGFPTISNDVKGKRSFGAGSEVKARTIKPKVKDFDSKKRITGIPGFNAFGAPSSKSGSMGDLFADLFKKD